MIAPHPTDLRGIIALFFKPHYGPFLWSVAVAMGSYAVILLTWVAVHFVSVAVLDGYTRFLTALCCAGMFAHVVTGLSIIRQNDEFMRALIGKRVTIAAFITFGMLTIWGLLTNIGLAPQFPLMFAYLLFISVHAASVIFINADRP